MATFRPKEIFQKAREAEEAGRAREAASHYASLSVYLRRRGKLPEALALIQRAISLESHPRLLLHLALTLELSNDSPAANTALARFVSEVVDKGKVEKYRSIVESTLEGVPRLRQYFYEQVLALDRTGNAAFLGRALSLREQGDMDGALGVLLDALRVDGDETEVLKNLVALLTEQSRFEEVELVERYQLGKIAKADLIVLLSPGGGIAPSEAGETLDALEKPLKDLIQELEREIGFSSPSAEAEIQPLLQEFRKRSNPILGEDAQARLDMALAFFEMGLLREAAEEVDRISESDPLFAQGQAFKGQVLMASGSELAALECYKASLRAFTKSKEVECEALYQISQIYFRLGDLRQAMVTASSLEKKDENYRSVRSLKNRILEALEASGKRGLAK
jgi:tetratricopeptide (TPR) repeat protein